nr:hypothetical protein CFP56_11966 [Quercus suber]
MPTRAYISKDEEQGKRDDDFRPARSSSFTGSGQWLKPWRWRAKRLLGTLAVVAFIYVFIRNFPTDMGPVSDRVDVRLSPGWTGETAAKMQEGLAEVRGKFRGGIGQGANDGNVKPQQQMEEPSGPPPKPKGARVNEKQYYNGAIKFYRLATTLQKITRTSGMRVSNRNVLFAASALKSAANLMPLACEMARRDRNFVHMAFLGRDGLSVEKILEINGVHRDDCPVYFHDARADFSEYSTDERAEHATKGAMVHLESYMHPQAMIMDDSKQEDAFFTRGMRAKATEYWKTLIEVPAGRYEEFSWISRLDSGSLGSWFSPKIDILIQVPSGTSGGLVRAIKNLQDADYAGLRVPRLTIELPNDLPHRVSELLKYTNWPPSIDLSPMKQSTLTLRHRISPTGASSEEASLRHLESFYPVNKDDNHLLILSPGVEVNPLYLHYLLYTILEHRHSASGSAFSDDLLGVSLDVPTTFLNGSKGFVPPIVEKMHGTKYTNKELYDQSAQSSFLYQAPRTSAALIFGGKWASLHDFLSNRVLAVNSGKAQKPAKLVSEKEPAWLEYLLELMRARGWAMLHPAQSFATVHNELYHLPEEFATTADTRKQNSAEVKKDPESLVARQEAFLTAEAPPKIEANIEHDVSTLQPLHKFLPFDGVLPTLSDLPYVKHDGELLGDITDADALHESYAKSFRREIGACSEADVAHDRVEYVFRTDDLFCNLPYIDPEFDADEVEEGPDDDDAQTVESEVDEKKGEGEKPTSADEGEADAPANEKAGAGSEKRKKS